jgi:hypothetical protein
VGSGLSRDVHVSSNGRELFSCSTDGILLDSRSPCDSRCGPRKECPDRVGEGGCDVREKNGVKNRKTMATSVADSFKLSSQPSMTMSYQQSAYRIERISV